MSLKAQWVVTVREHPHWAEIASNYLDLHMKHDIWRCNLSIHDIDLIGLSHSFWKQVLYAWAMCNFTLPEDPNDIAGQILWYNSNIRVNNQPICNANAWANGLRMVSDLISPNGIFHTHADIVAKFGNVLTWYEHIQLVSAIPHSWKEALLHTRNIVPNYYTNFDKLQAHSKISNIVYNKLIEFASPIQKC